MSAAVQAPTQAARGAQGFLDRFARLRGRLPGDVLAREAAAEHFRRLGLPSVREEAWRYTNLRPLAEAAFAEPLTAVSDEGAAAPETGIDAPALVFADGRYQAGLSRVPEEIEFSTFAERPEFGRLARPERDAFAALNAMLAEDGAQISVAEGIDAGTVVLLSEAADVHDRPVAFHPRHSFTLAPGARLTVVEIARGRGQYLHNQVVTVHVAEGAVLTHIRLQDEGPEAFHVATVYAEIAERGTYDCFVLTLGARLARAEIHARLLGAEGAVHLNGAQLLGGQQLGDITTVVAHDAPNCASRQTIKNVLSGRSRGVFQGRIEVARVAQKTDGYQMNQALLLSPDAEIDCKPQLEIFADDVKCSHGATVGELDADQLFYLRSRGVPAAEARSILVRAFLTEALDPIGHEGARALLERGIEAWWGRQAA